MSTISNRHADVEMWNLDSGPGKRGPFVIVQCGAAPGDDLEQLFLLRHDGKWVNALCFDSTGQSRWPDEMIFDSPRQFLQLLGRLADTAEVADLPFTLEGWRSWISKTGGHDPFRRLYGLAEQYQRGHKRPLEIQSHAV